MSRRMGRPSLGIEDGVLVKAHVPHADRAALDSLVAVTGEARASHIRRAISRYLAEFELADPATMVTPVTTIQRGKKQ